jgi:hypothetical protein
MAKVPPVTARAGTSDADWAAAKSALIKTVPDFGDIRQLVAQKVRGPAQGSRCCWLQLPQPAMVVAAHMTCWCLEEAGVLRKAPGAAGCNCPSQHWLWQQQLLT